MPCKRTSDCYSRCPSHPLTGDRYQCQKNYVLYDVAVTGGFAADKVIKTVVDEASKVVDAAADVANAVGSVPGVREASKLAESAARLNPVRNAKVHAASFVGEKLGDRAGQGFTVGVGFDGEIALINLTEGNSAAFDPDPAAQAATGEYGICVDVDSAMNQGCPDQTMSAIVDGVVGCFDRQVSRWLCGLEVDIKDGDTTTAAITGNFLYLPPRVLVAPGRDLDGDGVPTPALTCTDPVDCQQKCLFLERTSFHGPEPLRRVPCATSTAATASSPR